MYIHCVRKKTLTDVFFYISVENVSIYTKLGKNWGRSRRILTPNELYLTFWVPDYGAKFHQNRVRIATVEGGQTDVTDASEFIICPMLCYSNGTDDIKL